ncbi:hypothetical protein DRW03_33955 [Corallococcus sp. H22C18031201]|uniref:LPS assembly lipoprotein LptE n=1 Tax=Citreicoccus inhibens TaxID=2849499 RepID=UPI000E75A7C6|nr:LPS assembly lipoprotein LptE [Citreicoccus inhibens]MBU8899174.1 hypothetical protein [Citreicoccus inhibens]RJS15247.1 hypothetical protein DRW03_33955 [Corallococcus sp. H22C18031201]
MRPFWCVRRPRAGAALVLVSSLFVGCGYRLTPWGANLPEGLHSVCAPVMGNETAEPALETLFTRFLRQQLTQAGRLGTGAACDGRIEGTVMNVGTSPTIIANNYRVTSMVRLRLMKDERVLGETVVSGTEDYLQGTGDILEAEANRQAALARLAEVLMRDGYARLASAW